MINANTKINCSQNRQAAFDKFIILLINREIAELDSERKTDGKRLKQMIMSLKLRKNKNIPLFHSVDPS